MSVRSLGGPLRQTKAALKATPLDMIRQVVRQTVRRTALDRWFSDRVIAWPYRRYLVSDSLKMVYVQIPKVASGNIKRWMLIESGIPEEDWELHPWYGIHPFADRVFRMRDVRVLTDPAYLNVAFVRNPYRRLVSGFLDKFVLPYSGDPSWPANSPARPVLSWLAVRNGYRDRTRVTFNDFLDHVCASPDVVLDEHWLPQTAFLADVRMDLLGRLENFEADFQQLQDKLGRTAPLQNRKPPLRYGDRSGGYAGNLTIADLVGRPVYPPWEAFYSKKSARRVAVRYERDFRRLGYSSTIPVLGGDDCLSDGSGP